MIVRCFVNDISKIKSGSLVERLKQYINLDGPDNDLEIGNEYPVHAIENRGGHWWFYIHNVEVNSYPFPYPSEFFHIVRSGIPSHWTIKMDLINGQSVLARITFQEWNDDDLFYERLVEGDPEISKIYLSSRA